MTESHDQGHDTSDAHEVHTDPAALRALTDAAERERGAATEPVADGAVADYRPSRTLALSVELRRQLRRRRTQLLFGLIALLPFVLVAAFELGEAESDEGRGFVELATSSAPNFVVFALFVSGTFLLPMIVALFFGDTVASEGSWSSLKYLLAIPVPRHRVLRQKAFASALLSAGTIALLPAVALVVGMIFYGTGPAVSPTGESVSFEQSLLVLLLTVVYIVIQLSWVAGLGLLLSVSMDAPLGAVGGALLASIISGMLDQITALGGWRDFLPTHFAFAWIDLVAEDINWSDMASGVLSALCYATVFLLLATRHFNRKDITS